MFAPIHLLPLLDTRERDKCQNRWQEAATYEHSERVVRAIREYGNEDFLSRECDDLIAKGFLENETDLRGFLLQTEQLTLPNDWDNFKYTNFRYAQFYNSTIENATFFQVCLDFASIYKCRFVRCGFHFTSFYAATFDGVEFVECDFAQRTTFQNCDAKATSFERCFFHEPVFVDCRFDERTTIREPSADSNRWPQGRLVANQSRAELLKGIAEAYYAGHANELAESAVIAAAKLKTGALTGARWLARLVLLDWLLGYGLRPLRPLIAMLGVFGIASAIFGSALGFGRGVMLAAGALLTFGAGTDALASLSWGYKTVYLFTAFCGVTLTALFITSAAAYFTSRR